MTVLGGTWSRATHTPPTPLSLQFCSWTEPIPQALASAASIPAKRSGCAMPPLRGEEAQELSTYCLEEKALQSPRKTLNCACGIAEPEGRSPFGALDRGGSDALVEPEVSRVDLGHPPTFLAHTPPPPPCPEPSQVPASGPGTKVTITSGHSPHVRPCRRAVLLSPFYR